MPKQTVIAKEAAPSEWHIQGHRFTANAVVSHFESMQTHQDWKSNADGFTILHLEEASPTLVSIYYNIHYGDITAKITYHIPLTTLVRIQDEYMLPF